MSNIALSFEKDGSDGLTHNVQRGRKGTQNGVGRILGYQGLFLGRLPGDHFNISPMPFIVEENKHNLTTKLLLLIELLEFTE